MKKIKYKINSLNRIDLIKFLLPFPIKKRLLKCQNLILIKEMIDELLVRSKTLKYLEKIIIYFCLNKTSNKFFLMCILIHKG